MLRRRSLRCCSRRSCSIFALRSTFFDLATRRESTEGVVGVRRERPDRTPSRGRGRPPGPPGRPRRRAGPARRRPSPVTPTRGEGGDQVGRGCGRAERLGRLPGERGDHGLPGAEREHVLGERPDQAAGAGSVVVGAEHVRRQPAHHGHRPARQLALGQVGGAGHLVGERRGGDRERVAVAVDAAGVVVEDHEAGRADREVGLALPPGPAGGVGDDDGDVAPGGREQPAAQRPRAGVGVVGEEHHVAGARRWSRRSRPRPSPGRGGSRRWWSGRAARPPGRSRPASRSSRVARRRTDPRPCSRPCW